MKKMISLLLVVMLLAGCSIAPKETDAPTIQENPQNTTLVQENLQNTTLVQENLQNITPELDVIATKELERAESYGMIPEEWKSDLGKTITHQEFCTLVSQFIEKVKPESLPAWEELSIDAVQTDIAMGRDEGAIGLMYAAQALDTLYTNITDYADIHQVEQNPLSWEFESSQYWPEMPQGYMVKNYTPGTPSDATWEQPLGDNTVQIAFWFVLQRLSTVTERPLMDWDESYNLRMGENMTRQEAVIALLRLAESTPNLMEGNQYVSVKDVGTYETSIITNELLNTASTLPLPTQEALTDQWRGMGMGQVKNGLNVYSDFQEGTFAFFKEQNLNFCRVFLGFSTLRYPEYPEDLMQVNLTELYDLDQLIAWGIEYGVHIQLSMVDTPHGERANLDMSDQEWDAMQEYWLMLARRYAGIPSQYLSFDLMNEMTPAPEQVEPIARKTKALVDAVRVADADRILLISFNNNPWPEWVESVATMGVALGCHPYYPVYPLSGGNHYAPGQTSWPYPYFPSMLEQGETLTISGDIGGKTLRLDFWVYNPFQITFDNGETIVIDVPGDFIHEDSCGPQFYEPYSVEIPVGATRLELTPIQNGFLTLTEIGMGSGDDFTWLIVHDQHASCDRGGSDLIWSEGSGWSSEKNCDAEYVYQRHILPMQELAKENSVGFMINEIGSYAYGDGMDISVKQQYDEHFIAMMEEKNISWCMCEMEYAIDFMYTYINYGWENATLEQRNYLSEDGHQQSIFFAPSLMAVYNRK